MTFNLLEEKGIEASKILLQKLIFYLKESRCPVTFRFKAYTYGPFSFDLQNEVDDMVFWDELEKISDHSFTPAKTFTCQLDQSVAEKIRLKTDQFLNLIGNDTSFHTLELYGTAIYCFRVLQELDDEVELEGFVDEFRAWKGSKYKREEIEQAFSKLEPSFH